MENQKNELSININSSNDVSIENINQALSSNEQITVKNEIEDLLKILQIPTGERENLKIKLEEAKQAIKNSESKGSVSKILTQAGSFLKDLAKEAGKTAIATLIKNNI